jgi:hypothetical protein
MAMTCFMLILTWEGIILIDQLNLPSNVPYPQDDDDDENQSFSNLMSHFSNGGDDLEQIIQNERHNLVVDDSIKNDVRLTPSEINLLANEVANSKEFLIYNE